MLNDNQKIAVDHHLGPMMVLASPGSGKTTVVIHRIKNLIEKYNVNPEEISVITFSKAAAVEMEERFKALEVKGANGVTFGTFHSLFFRILRQHRNLRVDNILNEAESWKNLRSMVWETLGESSVFFDTEEVIKSFLSNLSLMKNELLDIEEFKPKGINKNDFVSLCRKYETYKEQNNKIDFDDMLTECYYLLKNHQDVLKKWEKKCKYILIDEFQDINKVQYECIRLLAEPENNIFIVGDDDQSIYKFRGARPDFLINFPKIYQNAKRVDLDINYRSTDMIIKLSRRLVENNKTRYKKQLEGTGTEGEITQFFSANSTFDEAEKISKSIKTFINKNIQPKEIAVIYRKNNQGMSIAMALNSLNIPYKLRDGISNVYRHWVAQDILSYIRLSLDINDNMAFARIVNKPKRYITKEIMETAKKAGGCLFRNVECSYNLQKYQASGIAELNTHLVQIKKRKPDRAIAYIRKVVGYDDYIEEYSEYRRSDSTEFFEIADELEYLASQVGDFDQLFEKIEQVSKELEENKTNIKKPSENAVTLTTMHSAKGLEFEAVFIPSMVEGIVPLLRSNGDDEIEEERRVFYVAVTRAKKYLCLSEITHIQNKETERSRFLKELGLKSRKENVRKY